MNYFQMTIFALIDFKSLNFICICLHHVIINSNYNFFSFIRTSQRWPFIYIEYSRCRLTLVNVLLYHWSRHSNFTKSDAQCIIGYYPIASWKSNKIHNSILHVINEHLNFFMMIHETKYYIPALHGNEKKYNI